MIDFIPMIRLCYMAQLILRKVDSMGGPDLITQPLKSKVINREVRYEVRYLKHRQIGYTTTCLKMEETMQQGNGTSVQQPQGTKFCQKGE